LPASLRKGPKQRERNATPSLTGPFGPALLNSPAAIPRWAGRPNDSKSSTTPDLRIIVLFGALGAIAPLIILLLEQDVGPHIGPDRLLAALRVLVWPASVLAVGAPGLISTLAALSSVILNVVIYLVVGSLIWLGLHPPRSTTYVAIVSIMYLMLVSVAAFCEWLLP
jgi:hypothetical protein